MNNNDRNISFGSSILVIWVTTIWGFGIVLSKGWFDTLVSIVFPPYGMLITFEWLIEIIKHFTNI